MTNNLKPLPLQVEKGIEPVSSWEGMPTPYELAIYIASLLSVDPKSLFALEEITVASAEPSGSESGKIWIKTDGAPALGIPIGGEYQMFYQYPPLVPFIWMRGESKLPPYLNKMSSDKLEELSLTPPTNTAYFYVQLIP